MHHHRYLLLVGLCFCPGAKNVKWKSEKRVDSLTTSVNGCNTRWSKNDEVLVNFFLNAAKKGRLSCTGTTCKEETRICFLNKVVCLLLLYCIFHFFFYFVPRSGNSP